MRTAGVGVAVCIAGALAAKVVADDMGELGGELGGSNGDDSVAGVATRDPQLTPEMGKDPLVDQEDKVEVASKGESLDESSYAATREIDHLAGGKPNAIDADSHDVDPDSLLDEHNPDQGKLRKSGEFSTPSSALAGSVSTTSSESTDKGPKGLVLHQDITFKRGFDKEFYQAPGGLLETDPLLDDYLNNPVPFLICIVAVGTMYMIFRRDNGRLRFALERFVHWIRRKAYLYFPVAAKQLASVLGGVGAALPKSKYSEYNLNFEADRVPKSPERNKDRKEFAELKLMSLKGRYTPKLKAPAGFSSIISESCMDGLVQKLPERLTCKDWQLLYATEKHGYSLQTAYQLASDSGPFILVVMDRERYVFGAFSSESLRCSGRKYYGTGESFIFQLQPELRVHGWSGQNDHFVVSTKDMLAFGGGRFALWLDACFEHGSSEEGSTTFTEYKRLASSEMFKCCTVEIWGFTSPSTQSPKKSVRKGPLGFSMGNPLV